MTSKTKKLAKPEGEEHDVSEDSADDDDGTEKKGNKKKRKTPFASNKKCGNQCAMDSDVVCESKECGRHVCSVARDDSTSCGMKCERCYGVFCGSAVCRDEHLCDPKLKVQVRLAMPVVCCFAILWFCDFLSSIFSPRPV